MMHETTIGPHERAEIFDLLGRYLWAVDTGDALAVVAAFSSDGVVRYGAGERYEGEAGLRRFAQRVIGDASVRGRMHLNHPLFFWRKEDLVVLRSYMVPVQLRPGAPTEPIRSLRYTEDTFVKTDAGWRIKERAIFLWDQVSRADA
jgi:SnoaL-like domain